MNEISSDTLKIPDSTKRQETSQAQSRTASEPSPSRLYQSAEQLGLALYHAFHRSEEPAFLLDPYEGKIIRANPAASAFFRLPGGSLDGITIDKLYPHLRAELYIFTEEAIALGHAHTRQLTLSRPDGNPIQLEHTAVALSDSGRTGLFVRLTNLDALHRRDINEAAELYLKKGLHEWLRDEQYFREIEREYRLILAAAGEGIYGVGNDGRTTFLNPAAERLLGYRADELVGSDMHELIHHHRHDGTPYPTDQCPIYNAFKDGKVNTVEDEVFWRKDGTPIPVEYTSTPIVDSGNVVGAVIVFRDMSERRKNQENLRQALLDNAALRERLELENAYLQEEIRSRSNHHDIIGQSESLTAQLAQIDLVAPTDANVLVTGESGTGKELIAHAIHRASSRADRPLIRVNCAAIPRELFESEFFGHVKGSFSGALKDRIGRFELADGGTLFLDEVGELEITLQAKLLRVVQEGRFERVGEESSRQVDVRLIAATNQDLKKAVEKGTFREDLFFRLNVFPIECIPLRQRASDIPMMAEHFLHTTCQRLNLPAMNLSRANVKKLMDYNWPGNIRELQNVIERAAILARNGRLTIDLPSGKAHGGVASSAEVNTTDPQRILSAAEMAAFEQQNLQRALNTCGGKVSGPDGAAALLGMKPTTLYSRLRSKK